MPEEVYRVNYNEKYKRQSHSFSPLSFPKHAKKTPRSTKKHPDEGTIRNRKALSSFFYSFSLFESSAGSSCGKIMEEDSGTLRSRDSHVTKRDGMEIVGETRRFHNKTVPKSFATKRTGRLVGTE